jgi:hypothetical protein
MPWQPAHLAEKAFWPVITLDDFASDFTFFDGACALPVAPANTKSTIACSRNRI